MNPKSILLNFFPSVYNSYIGVAQGSVLGPLLFLLYINDLQQNIQAQVRLLAKYTTVYLTVGSSEDWDILQADLDTLQEWDQA